MVAILWGIWFFKNKRVWEDKTVTAHVVVKWGKSRIAEWSQAKKHVQQQGSGKSAKPNQVHKWKKPAPGAFKINVDVAIPNNDHHFFIGMLIRDSSGAFIQGKMMKFAGHVSALEAEARGVWETLVWIDNLGLNNIQIETDSLLTVAAVESLEANYLEVGNVIDDCKSWLHERSDICLVHVRRQVNKTAHLLAYSPC